MGAGTADPPPGASRQGGDAAGQRGRRSSSDEYLDAVTRETLRIRPVVFDVGRMLKEPVELAGYRLPAGVMVTPGMVLVHADSAQYPAPRPVRPGPDARGDTETDDVSAVRRRQPPLPGRDLRDGRDASRAARGASPGRAVHHNRAAERQKVKHVILIPHRGARIRVRARKRRPCDPAVASNAPSCMHSS